MEAQSRYEQIRVPGMQGRYLPPGRLNSFLHARFSGDDLRELGRSVRGLPIYAVRLGRGPKKVMAWSQMHGNESTTTRALMDLVHEIMTTEADFLQELTLFLIPMLNPDGAEDYTRMNANQQDLNRDAQELSQPESRVLRQAFKEFQPDFCLNLHDQRTIYSAGDARVPATISLLAPATDADRSFPPSRERAARLTAFMAASLAGQIGIGRYDDAFNPNCVGDFCQSRAVPTVLIEAGHYPGDYDREMTRYYVYRILKTALGAICSGRFEEVPLTRYFEIPENRIRFVDVLIRNAHALGFGLERGSVIGIQFDEELEEGRVHFTPRLTEEEDLSNHFGHAEWDAGDPQQVWQLRDAPEIWALLQREFL